MPAKTASRSTRAAPARARASRRPGGTPRHLLHSAGNALRVVEFVSGRPDGVTLTHLSREMGFSKPTAQRLLATLLSRGWIRPHPSTGRYVLALRVWEIGCGAIDRLGVQAAARPWLQRLAAETGETALLAVLDGLDVVYVDKATSEQAVQATARVGSRSPAYATGSGKALLAFQPPRLLGALRGPLRAFTPYTVTGPGALATELRTVAHRGWALNNEEYRPGVRSVAAPVRDAAGEAVAAVSLAGPSYRLPRSRLYVLAGRVVECAQRISGELGFLPGGTAARRA